MRFRTLDIENFLAISEASIDLADRGLVLIQGANEDDPSATSNGAGKSSLADALCWVLYGTTARGVTGDSVVNRDAGRNCRVQLAIEADGQTYRVTRHRKHKTEKNALRLSQSDGLTETDLTEGTDKLTQERLEKLIGCSYEVFKAAVYAGQEQMPDLPAMTDKGLKILVEEAAGITVLESAYTIARTRAAMAKMQAEEAARSLSRAEEIHAHAVAQIDEAKAEVTRWETSRAADIARLNDEVKAIVGAARPIKTRIETEKPQRLAERDALQDQLASVQQERDEETRLAGILAAADREVMRAQAELDRVSAEARRAKAHLEGIDSKEGSPCGECGKPYTSADLETARTLAKDKLTSFAVALRDAKQSLEAAQKARETHAGVLEAHRAGMTDVSEASASLREILGHLDALGKLERELADMSRQAREKAERAKALQDASNPHTASVERATDRAKTAADAVIAWKAKVEEAGQALELIEHAVKVFAPAGVRAHVLDTVTPFLNDRTAAYLGTLSDGNITASWSTLSRTAKGELREKFCIDVAHAKGGEGFAALSGGEKRKVRVATALALQDLVASRATKPIGLFIGDEIDDALDKAGLERLMSVLEEKARERGSVFVISHNDLKDWIDDVVLVRKAGGASVLEAA